MRIENPKVMASFADLGVVYRPSERMADWTSLGVGGETDLLQVTNFSALPLLLSLLDEEGVVWRCLGGGTNLLIADESLPFVVVQLAPTRRDLEFGPGEAYISAAAELGRAVMECAKRDLGGMEGLIGVPGTVGGALRMNAGAYGTQIGSFVRSILVYRAGQRRIETLTGKDIRFEYRHSSFAPDDIMLSVRLELPTKPYREILSGIQVCNEKRRASQPLNEKSAGCIFKNPPGGSAGRMIDGLGLKGYRIGGAVVSERHANFFVNRSGASAGDLLALVDYVRDRVRQSFGVELEEEVIVWRT
jgi:UDP-N-acetylmuramate dehydrogenase